MKGFRLRSFVLFALAGVLGSVLLYTSQAVQEAQQRKYTLERSNQQLSEGIEVLKAEWEYLNAPQRLEHLSAEYLDLVPPRPEQMNVHPDLLPDAMQVFSEGDMHMQFKRQHQTISLEPANLGNAPSSLIRPPKKKPVIEGPEKQTSFEGLVEELRRGP